MQDVKQRVALSSIAASAGLTVAKAIVGVISGSLAILSEAAHSLIDLGATLMTYYAVRVSGKPADAEHHYGHGKVESVRARGNGAAVWARRRRHLGGGETALSAEPPHVEATAWAFAVMLLSIVVDFFRARALNRVANRPRARRSKPTRCISVPTCGRRSRSSSGSWHHARLCLGGLGGRDSGVGRHLHRGLAARPAHHRYAHRYRAARSRRQNHRHRGPHPRHGRARTGAGAPVGEVLFVDLVVAVSRTLPLDRVALLKERISKRCAPKGRRPR